MTTRQMQEVMSALESAISAHTRLLTALHDALAGAPVDEDVVVEGAVDEERYLRPAQVTALTGLSRSTIDNYSKRPSHDPDHLPRIKIGQTVRFRAADVHAWMSRYDSRKAGCQQ